MKVALFSVHPYEKPALQELNETFQHELTVLSDGLTEETIPLAAGCPAISCFANDVLTSARLSTLAQNGTQLVALRCAGFNNVDLKAAAENGITIMRVPTYSPHAIAEYTIGMVIALDRRIPQAWERVRAGNFDLAGLVGAGINGKTVGIVGTGKIGAIVAKVFRDGFGCEVLAHDLYPNKELIDIGIQYVDDVKELLRRSDIVSLHCPLTPESRHLIKGETLQLMKPGAILVNTGRGGLVHTPSLIDALEAGRIGGCGLDVYEGEEDFFLQGKTTEDRTDKNFKRLVQFPQVIVTGHQAFLTHGAVNTIAKTTLQNIADFENGKAKANIVSEHGK
jgi:D-lactate dehydrogenase